MKNIIKSKIINSAVIAVLAMTGAGSAMAWYDDPVPLSENEESAFNRHVKKYQKDVYESSNLLGMGIGYIRYWLSAGVTNPSGAPYYETMIMDQENMSTDYVGALMFAPIYKGEPNSDSDDAFDRGEYVRRFIYDANTTTSAMAFAYDYKSPDSSPQSAVVYPTEGLIDGADVIEFSTTRPSSSTSLGSLKDAIAGYFLSSDTYFCVESAVTCQSGAPIIFANVTYPDYGYIPSGKVSLTKIHNFVVPYEYATAYKANGLSTLDSYFYGGAGEIKHTSQSVSGSSIDFTTKTVTLKVTNKLRIRAYKLGVISQDDEQTFVVTMNGSMKQSAEGYWTVSGETTKVTCTTNDQSHCPTDLRITSSNIRIAGRKADKIIFDYHLTGKMAIMFGTDHISLVAKGLGVLSKD